MLRFMPCALVLLAVSAVCAGEFNPTLSIGDAAPDWKELPGVDDKPHSLADFKEHEIVVVFFTCNSCGYATDYEDRTIALAKKYGGGDNRVGFVAVNVNKIEEDRLPAMKAKAEKKKFPFVYVFDETQQIARDYGATTTPEFFVLDRDRKIAYMGALDDHSDPAQAKVHYVQEAIDALLAGKALAKKETVPIGCLVRYERMRRTR